MTRGRDQVLAIYSQALPRVYGYLLPRCADTAVAEDLTAETFLAALAAADQPDPPEVTVAWLVGVARHKLVDHWRKVGREQRALAASDHGNETVDDPWDEVLDASTAYAALARLPGHQRAALILRYLDDLTVAEVAAHLGRSLHATETLLVRARTALRRVYQEERDNA
ncbi:MAG TPA: RNA polymerase sigma factor [Streptosporangiaceae bacterium]|nr:RNA polymerase sigma factor [Streptosporangiaceae bacterium]